MMPYILRCGEDGYVIIEGEGYCYHLRNVPNRNLVDFWRILVSLDYDVENPLRDFLKERPFNVLKQISDKEFVVEVTGRKFVAFQRDFKSGVFYVAETWIMSERSFTAGYYVNRGYSEPELEIVPIENSWCSLPMHEMLKLAEKVADYLECDKDKILGFCYALHRRNLTYVHIAREIYRNARRKDRIHYDLRYGEVYITVENRLWPTKNTYKPLLTVKFLVNCIGKTLEEFR